MPLKMKQLPQSERPYEKLLMYGPKKLSNAELLAIIIKTGTKDETSVDIANRVLLLSENINGLANIGIGTLEKIKGIGKVKAIQIKAVCELATRLNAPIHNIKTQMKKTVDVYNVFKQEFKQRKQEVLKLILLNSKTEIVKIIELETGSISEMNVAPAQILKEVIKEEVDKFILVHNHPSGDATPSEADIKITKKIDECSKLFDVNFLDHIVIGQDSFTSIRAILNEEKNKSNEDKNKALAKEHFIQTKTISKSTKI